MWNDGGDPVAALDRLDRMRGAQVAREYTDWAGIDRGYQTIWSGRPGIWIRGRVIDLGRRPDTGRAAPDHLRVQNPTKPAPRRAGRCSPLRCEVCDTRLLRECWLHQQVPVHLT